MYQQNVKVPGPSISQFNSISASPVPRSNFQSDFTKKGTFNIDYWIPWIVKEILPGDLLHYDMTMFARLTTPLRPFMDNLYLDSASFFNPNRIAFPNWVYLQGEQISPGDSTAISTPVMNHAVAPMSTTGFLEHSIYDFAGIPTKVTDIRDLQAIPFRSMGQIFDYWLRDENLTDSIMEGYDLGNGPDDPAFFTLAKFKSRKKKDYITSCLPWPQKGTAVTIPLGTRAPVRGIGFNDGNSFTNSPLTVRETTGTTTYNWRNPGAAPSELFVNAATNDAGALPDIYADLSSASAATLRLFRQSAIYQQILELDARGGTRYPESLNARFGVTLPDRQWKPELIAQGSQMISSYPVPQTSATSGSNFQGGLGAFATSLGKHQGSYAAVEHGWFILMIRVRGDLVYQQGLDRQWTRRTRYDFYEPLLNGMGEMAVLNREVRCVGGTDATTGDYGVFGYNEQFSDYRFNQSQVVGYFRSNATGTLDSWHLSEQFSSTPGLNDTFIRQNTPIDRILTVATATAPNFIADSYIKWNITRPMPLRTNPGIDVI